MLTSPQAFEISYAAPQIARAPLGKPKPLHGLFSI